MLVVPGEHRPRRLRHTAGMAACLICFHRLTLSQQLEHLHCVAAFILRLGRRFEASTFGHTRCTPYLRVHNHPRMQYQFGDCYTCKQFVQDSQFGPTVGIDDTSSASASVSPPSAMSDVWKYLKSLLSQTRRNIYYVQNYYLTVWGTSNLREHLLTQHPLNYKPKASSKK